LYILQMSYDVQKILTIVGCMQDEGLQEKWYAVGSYGKPQVWLHSWYGNNQDELWNRISCFGGKFEFPFELSWSS